MEMETDLIGISNLDPWLNLLSGILWWKLLCHCLIGDTSQQCKHYAPSQASVLHVWVAAPTQFAPACAGVGLVQVLLWLPPPPQRVEHALKGDHPPFTFTLVPDPA